MKVETFQAMGAVPVKDGIVFSMERKNNEEASLLLYPMPGSRQRGGIGGAHIKPHLNILHIPYCRLFLQQLCHLL